MKKIHQVPVVQEAQDFRFNKLVLHIVKSIDELGDISVYCDLSSGMVLDKAKFSVPTNSDSICPACRAAYVKNFKIEILQPESLPPVLQGACMVWRQGDSKPLITSLPEREAQDYALKMADMEPDVDFHVIRTFAVARTNKRPTITKGNIISYMPCNDATGAKCKVLDIGLDNDGQESIALIMQSRVCACHMVIDEAIKDISLVDDELGEE
jgi:hypothetical protein